MYYLLKERFLLRGWEKLLPATRVGSIPKLISHQAVDRHNKEVQFENDERSNGKSNRSGGSGR